MTDPCRYLDVPGCAAYLSMTPTAIRNMVARGSIPYAKLGRRVRFDRERLDRWVRAETVRGARQTA